MGRKGDGVTRSAEGERHPTEDGSTDVRWSQGDAAVRRTRMLRKLQFGVDVEFFSAGMQVTRNQGLATPRPAAQFRDGAVRRHRGRPGNAAASRTHLTAHDGSLHPGGHSRPPERRHYDPRRQARSVATCGRFTWQKRGSTPWQYGRDRVSPVFLWSGRRGSNPRPTAWEAVTLPLSYSRSLVGSTRYSSKLRSGDATQGLL